MYWVIEQAGTCPEKILPNSFKSFDKDVSKLLGAVDNLGKSLALGPHIPLSTGNHPTNCDNDNIYQFMEPVMMAVVLYLFKK